MSLSRRHLGLALVSAVGAGVSLRLAQQMVVPAQSSVLTGFEIPEPRPTPVSLLPYSGLEGLVPRSRIGLLLSKLAPCWSAIKVSHVIHALRLWGRDASFPIEDFNRISSGRQFSGKELLDFFVDDAFYRSVAPGAAPLFVPSRFGCRAVYTSPIVSGFVGQLSHRDDFLRVCCDLGLPLSTQLATSYGKSTVADLLSASLAEFHLEHELEWSLECYARYLAPNRTWNNALGSDYSFDSAVLRMLESPPGTGACLGTHVNYTISALLQVHEQCPIMSGAVIQACRSRLLETCRLLETTGLSESGGWKGEWSEHTPRINSDPMSISSSKLMSTGHHLEWIAMAPPDLRPDKAVIQDVANAVLDDILNLTIFQSEGGYLLLSHLARALCLMERSSPIDVLRRV